MSTRAPAPHKTSPSDQLPAKKANASKHATHEHHNAQQDPPSRSTSLLTRSRRLQSGRTSTAPSALDTLWTTGASSPQLSERDSIFASTWEQTESPPKQSPPNHGGRKSLSAVEEQDDLPDLRPLPSSSLMEAPVVSQNEPKSSSTQSPDRPNQGEPQLRRLSDIRTNTTPTFQISLTKQRGLLKDNRLFLDDPLTDLPPGMSPVSTPFERPSTPQSLRFSSDAISPDVDDEERLRYRSWREGKPTLPRSKLKEEEGVVHRSTVDKKIEATLPKADLGSTTARSRKTSHYLGLFKSDVQEQRRRADRIGQVDEQARQEGRDFRERISALSQAAGRGRLEATATKQDVDELAESLASDKSKGLPADLLEQIRKHRHFTTATPQHPDRSRSGKATRRSKEESGALVYADGKTAGHVVGTDEDESEKEQISSAVYFPHWQRTLEEQKHDVEEDERPQTAPDLVDREYAERKQKKEGAHSPDEVQISLEGADDLNCLHGDLPPTTAAQKALEERFLHSSDVSLTASESEYESQDDMTEYDTVPPNELVTTPTPKVSQNGLQTAQRPHERRAPVPVGAVELKPYDHQVGGHSTVYRFSRRAVCKQLNNKENEFYETVERSHPELLEFLPRYDIFIHSSEWLEC